MAMGLPEWKKLVAAPVAALLKQRGFRKSGMTFAADRPGAVLVVSIQSSTSSTQGSLKVTANVGISLDILAAKFGSGGRSVWESHWNKRIGSFLSSPEDHWWFCRSDAEATLSGEEMALLLETRALPEMERLGSPEALAALWATGACPGLTGVQRLEYLKIMRA
jgi:hypothetical protein